METRLKKSLDSCGICLQKVVKSGQIDCCRHLFCLQCIQNWSEIENTCPLCKRRFSKIESKVMRKQYCQSKPKKIQPIQIKPKDQGESVDLVTFTALDLTIELFRIMEVEPDLWQAFLQSQMLELNEDQLRIEGDF